MSFKSVLSKIEDVIKAAATDASIVYPFLAPLVSLIPSTVGGASVQSALQVGYSDLQKVAHMSMDVQALVAAGGITALGSQKAAAIAPKISVLMQDIEDLSGNKLGKVIKDPAEWNAAMQDMAMAVGRALKACGD